jgi:hypothetical protein
MPFDPSLPATGSPLQSLVIRNQLVALFNLITTAATSAQVDGVTTLPAGNPATVDAAVSGGVLHLTFALPQGGDGPAGAQGNDGPQGPPFAQAIVDSVTTVNPDTAATVNVGFDGSNVHFAFGIPRGVDGANGINGEVTAAELSNAIADTSRNTNAVGTLDTPFSNEPPTLADLEIMRQKLNELILAMRR